MASASDLSRDLARALEAQDEARVRELREQIADRFPDAPEAAEANFRLGLIALFRSGDLDQAEARLRLAAKAKDKIWSPRARTSLGMLLHKKGKTQQAVFELRRVASKKSRDIESAQALGLVALVYRETGNGKEADRARQEQLKLLEALTQSGEGDQKAFAHYLLGMEHKHDGRRDRARTHLEAALADGVLPADESDRIKSALREV